MLHGGMVFPSVRHPEIVNMSTPAPATATKPKGKKKLLIIAVVAILAGATAPLYLGSLLGKGKPETKKTPKKLVSVPFGDATVNLSDERLNRYLRVKINLLVTAEKEKEVIDHVTKNKAVMKSWLIGYLAGKTVKDVAGTAGVKRIQREIMERFEEILYPEGESHLHEVLFEDYVIQ